MSEKNAYLVKATLNGFHEIELGKKIVDCEFGFEHNQCFLSTVINADTQEEARRKGALRLKQVLSVFVIHTGVSYTISSIRVEQIAGEEPFLCSAHMNIERMTYLPLGNEKIAEIQKSIEILDRLPNQEQTTARVDRSINYFLRGCYLETKWRSEAFLNFFKVIELVCEDFKESFERTVCNQLKNTLLEDLTRKEVEDLKTQKRLVRFACKQLGITSDFDISEIIRLRPKFSAHATLEEVTVSTEEFNNCKALAGKIIINYLNHIQVAETSSSPA